MSDPLNVQRNATDPVSILIPEDFQEYQFFQLTELLLSALDEDAEHSAWGKQTRLLFSTYGSLGFPASEISQIHRIQGALDAPEKLNLETTFMGLNGAQSPLPNFLLEAVSTEDEFGARKVFLDFFNHRLLTLLYQIWRKYRYYVRFREDATDNFSAQLFSLVGLGDDRLRGETPINWCKMLSYAGLLMGRSRSPQAVSGIIAHCFDLDNVEIKEWQKRIIPIPHEQQMQLGIQNMTLGSDTVIGAQIADCMGKFKICLNDLSEARFADFLPSGKDHQALLTLVEFILREQMAFDLELVIKNGEVQPLQLSQDNPPTLGWFSFLGEGCEERRVCIQIRQ